MCCNGKQVQRCNGINECPTAGVTTGSRCQVPAAAQGARVATLAKCATDEESCGARTPIRGMARVR